MKPQKPDRAWFDKDKEEGRQCKTKTDKQANETKHSVMQVFFFFFKLEIQCKSNLPHNCYTRNIIKGF